MRSLQEVRVENWVQTRRTGFHKQYTVTDFDRGILRDAAASLGLSSYLTLHPSWMYQDLQPFWTMHEGLGWLEQRLAFGCLSPPKLEGLTLPEKFVAVRFYFRPTFPATPQTVSFCQATVEKIAKQYPVVVIESGVHADDHADVPIKPSERVIRLRDLVPMTPENNLAIQSAVLGKASACIGTYGGMTQYASAIGLPTIAVYDQWHSVALAHRQLSEWMAMRRGVPFHVLKIGELGLFQSLLPTAQVVLQSSS